MYRFRRLHTWLRPHHFHLFNTVLELVFLFVISMTSQVLAVTRLTNRSLFMYNVAPGAVSKYEISFTYTTSTTVGSLDILFCTDPIPQFACVPPPGLDVSNAQLISQDGITGYTISKQTKNEIVLSRTPGVVGSVQSSYTFSNIINPSDTEDSFAARLADYPDTSASGVLIDLGSVLSESSVGLSIDTQVPPMLIFCAAHQVSQDCSQTSGGNYSDMGTLSPLHTLTATSQMAAGTNASMGYVITVYGPTMSAGTSVINNIGQPSLSTLGDNQFGINLVANNLPDIGDNPDGSFTNANPTPDYDIPNKFTYNNGDVVASAPNVALVRRYTVSYIVNTSPSLRAGVYTTTISYVCSGRF